MNRKSLTHWSLTFVGSTALTYFLARPGPASPPEPADLTSPERATVEVTSTPLLLGDWAEVLEPAAQDSDSGLPQRVRDRGTGIEMVLIPAGTYVRGSLEQGKPNEQPAHPVQITRPFYLGVTEVTQAQWAEALRGTLDPRLHPSHHPNPDNPVESVSFAEVQVFLQATGLRLPTEAEWEYACRAGETGDQPLRLQAWLQDNCTTPQPVNSLRNGTNAWGLADMFGNVAEWCSDRFDPKYYHQGAQRGVCVDPQGPTSGQEHTIRGTWHGDNRRDCRFAVRRGAGPRHATPRLGFRVAHDL